MPTGAASERTPDSTSGARIPSRLPRLEVGLRLFTDVRPGGGLTAVIMIIANVFLSADAGAELSSRAA